MTESSASEHHSEQTHSAPGGSAQGSSAQDHWERGFHEAKEAFSEARKGFEKVAEAFMPPAAACEHFRQSRVELLKGVRAMIDHQIEHLSKGAPKGTRVTVE